MSSSKRRKLDSSDAQSPTTRSAVSAIAARRQLTASAGEAKNDSSPAQETSVAARANPFSPLQNLRQQASPGTSTWKRDPTSSSSRGKSSIHDATVLVEGPAASGDKWQSLARTSTDARRVQYSSFQLSNANYRSRAGHVKELRLSEGERFLVLGSYGIQVLTGEVTVANAALQASESIRWIHAPLCCAIPVVRTTKDTRLKIHPDPQARGLRKLHRLSPLFRGIWNEPPEAPQSFELVCTSDDVPKRSLIQELASPPEWNKKLSTVLSQASHGSHATLVCGPKSSGKSTFLRLLANRIVTTSSPSPTKNTLPGVALLDLDPGQPEYTPSGLLSLVHITSPNLGTPFTHSSLGDSSTNIVRCHALASVTPAMDSEFYLKAAIDLFDTYKTTLNDCSLLINTPGWILGTGLDLLVGLITAIDPIEVIYMSKDGPAESVDALRDATKHLFTTLPSQQSEFTSRTAAHLRAMQTMSYFHREAGGDIDATTRLGWDSSPLSSNPPWQVHYSGSEKGILGIISYDLQSPPDLLSEAINGMILAVVEIEHPKAFRDFAESPLEGLGEHFNQRLLSGDISAVEPLISLTPEGLPYISNPGDCVLDPQYSRTVGLVLIRGIDTAARSLQVLTPIASQIIQQIKAQGRNIVFVHGKFDPPTWAYTEDLYERSGSVEYPRDKLEVVDEDTSDDDDSAEPENVERARDIATAPWVEVLRGDEKRPVGSRVWRVRRDLGRNAGGE